MKRIGPALEGFHESAECAVQDRTDEPGEHATRELAGKMKVDLATAVVKRLEAPADPQLAQWAVLRIDEDAPVCPLESDAAAEALAKEPVGDRHLAEDHLWVAALRA